MKLVYFNTFNQHIFMNQAHFHLVVNHLPIIIPIIGLIIMISGFILQSEIVKRTAYGIFILGALCIIPALATGEGAEEIVENIPNISKSYIKQHEEMAETFAISSYILGGLSLIGLWANIKQKKNSPIISICTIILAIVVLFFAKQTGTSGGKIRHTEIR